MPVDDEELVQELLFLFQVSVCPSVHRAIASEVSFHHFNGRFCSNQHHSLIRTHLPSIEKIHLDDCREMAENYDNWERLVRAVLRREGDRELALRPSGDLSSVTLSSLSSTSESTSHDDIPMDYSDLTVDHSEWKAMLPPHKQIVVWKSAFLSFFLDPTTGKNCFLLGIAKLLLSKHWAVHGHLKSRFEMVAVPSYSVRNEMTIDIRGRIKTQMLSPETLYASYLVFQLRNKDSHLELDSACSMSSSVRFMQDTESDYDHSERQDDHDHQTSVLSFRQGNDRGDGWMEMKLGDIYVDWAAKEWWRRGFWRRPAMEWRTSLLKVLSFGLRGFQLVHSL
ncbi:UNVERIFIED_CONTAM: hypothetical protein Sradi_2704100 [Sesamum radiatum]|uniref:Uncharacterized protein n=1 Tax=Sesamum radiatum TaxID=300843 RepID=A0AAW2S789_SESRA